MSGIDIPATIGAITTLATPLGAGIIWIVNQFKLIRKELDQCEDGRALDRVVIELFWQALNQHDPNSPALARAKILLDSLKEERKEKTK